jgi:hypothetical protein
MARTDDIGAYIEDGETLATEGTLQEILTAITTGTGFPIATSATNTSVTVGSVSTPVIASNADR